MLNSPLVSIIIPCFNDTLTLSEAIHSALSQTYENKEVIVIDDGSTDNCLEIIKSFGKNIRWETGPNRGGCAARNRGIEIARGEIIQFLDADDLLRPSKLSIQVPLLQSKTSDIVFCDWKTTSLESEYTTNLHFDEMKQDLFLFLLRRNIQTSAPLHWRRNLLAIGGFRVGLPCCQEYDLHLRLALSGYSMKRAPEVLVVVRRQPKSVSSNYIRVLDQHSDVFENCLNVLKAREEATAKYVLGLAKAFAIDARNYYRMGETNKALLYLNKSCSLMAQHKSVVFFLLSNLGRIVVYISSMFVQKRTQS
jgi:glycosyltransferase involved in cell wall biosynthesis